MILAGLAALAGLIFALLFCTTGETVEEEFVEDDLSFEEDVPPVVVKRVAPKK